MILDKIPYMQIVLYDTQTWFILFYEKSAVAIYKHVRAAVFTHKKMSIRILDFSLQKQ